MSEPTFTFSHVDLTVDDGVAIVTLDRSGSDINTLGPHLLDDFSAVLDRLERDTSIRAVVLCSAKEDFLVGADIKWFSELTTIDDAADAIRQGHELFDRLEAVHQRYGKPVVAAIHGAALGGGCELALACSTRIATSDPRTKLGQPEVQLGVIPAGGGTQRLPALIGIASALDLILTGRTVPAAKARRLGLVDETVPPELLMEVALRRAREAWRAGDGSSSQKVSLSGRVTKLALESNPVGRRLVFSKAREALLERTRGNYPAPERALDAVRIGIEQGRSAGLDAESRYFGELVVSPQSQALRSIFFATRELDKERWGVSAEPAAVNQVAVLGGGLMGGGIAAVSTLKADTAVRIKEVDPRGVARGLAHVAGSVRAQVKRRRLSAFEGEKARLRVTGSHTWDGFADADLVIEAVFEDLELKRSILAEVEERVPEFSVFATNTSSLPIGDIAAEARHPDRVLGMHYFSPVEKMPLLEIITTPHTSDEALATAVEFGKRQGKTVIVVNDATGFYTTRVLGPYTNEAMYLLEEGASIESIDEAMEDWGFPVGPIRLSDEVGLDVGAKIGVIMEKAFGDRMAGPAVLERLMEDERHGRKNGRGFYAYSDGERTGVDESVYDVMGLGPRIDIPRLQIQRRISLAFINEAVRCLEDGVLRTARDGDIGAVMGLGFPPFRGGPFWYVDEVGAGDIVQQLDELAARHGPRFQPAELLRQTAASGAGFRT